MIILFIKMLIQNRKMTKSIKTVIKSYNVFAYCYNELVKASNGLVNSFGGKR